MTGKILIVVPSLYRLDAIGTDVFLQYECLKSAGKDAFIYAEQFDPSLQNLTINHQLYLSLIADQKNLILYHFGVFWHGLPELIHEARARIWIKYHNVTPPDFFQGWDDCSFHATAAGQNQAKWLATQPKVELFIGASQYNLNELSQLVGKSLSKQTVLAPMIDLLTDEAETDSTQSVPLALEPNHIHALFVGRVVPNKGHKHLVGILRSFRDLYPDTPITLHIAGANHPNFKRYYDFLMELARVCKVSNNLIFWDKVPANTLKNLYRQATVFLCMSEHEGFCVPVIEAQQASLPILALSRAAVPDTLGPQQMLLEEAIDYDLAATLIKEMSENHDLRRYLVMHGRRNAARFSKQILQAQFLQLINDFN